MSNRTMFKVSSGIMCAFEDFRPSYRLLAMPTGSLSSEAFDPMNARPSTAFVSEGDLISIVSAIDGERAWGCNIGCFCWFHDSIWAVHGCINPSRLLASIEGLRLDTQRQMPQCFALVETRNLIDASFQAANSFGNLAGILAVSKINNLNARLETGSANRQTYVIKELEIG